MITFQDISKSYGEVQALHDVSFTIQDGEVFGFVGADGAGKSTLLRILLGLMRPDAGTVTIHGEAPGRVPVGYVAQRFSLYPNLTARENMELMGALYGLDPQQARDRATEMLNFVGLGKFADRFAGTFSGGMKQKLALASAWAHEPKYLVLDEPTTGVDAVSRREFWQLLYQTQRQGATVVIATPYLDEASYCHRIAFFDHGHVLDVATPLAMQRKIGPDATLEDVFFSLSKGEEA